MQTLSCGILAPQLRIEPGPTALGAWVLTTGPPRKSLKYHFLREAFHIALSKIASQKQNLKCSLTLL